MRDVVIQAVADALNVDTRQITEETGVGDLPQWDSLGHINVITSVEKATGKQFDIATQMDIQNVRDLIMAVEE